MATGIKRFCDVVQAFPRQVLTSRPTPLVFLPLLQPSADIIPYETRLVSCFLGDTTGYSDRQNPLRKRGGEYTEGIVRSYTELHDAGASKSVLTNLSSDPPAYAGGSAFSSKLLHQMRNPNPGSARTPPGDTFPSHMYA